MRGQARLSDRLCAARQRTLEPPDLKHTVVARLALAGAVAAAFAIRLWGLDAKPIWWDEAFTVNTARQDWLTFWYLQAGERHPPLYFVLVWLWGPLAGWTEYALRFASVIPGVVAVALVGQLARRTVGAAAGVLAAAIMAVLPSMVLFSQDGRMYSLFVALAAAVVYRTWSAHLRGASRPPAPTADPILWGLEAALALTHYFALPLLAAVNLVVVGHFAITRRPLRAWLAWMGGQAVAVAPLVLWIAVAAALRGGLPLSQEPAYDAVSFFRLALALWGSGERDLVQEFQWVVEPLLLALILAALVVLATDWRRGAPTVAFTVVAAGLAYLFGSIVRSYHPRYLLPFAIPAVVILAGALAASVPARPLWRGLGFVVAVPFLVSLIGGWSVAANYPRDQTRAMAAVLRAEARPGDILLMEAFDFTMSYYDVAPARVVIIDGTSETLAREQIIAATRDAPRVWLASWIGSVQDPNRYWRFLLAKAGRLGRWESFYGYDLFRYDLVRPVSPELLEPPPPFALEGLVLAGWTDPVGHASSGALPLALRWEKTGPTRWNAISLRLRDPDGRLVAQRDAPLIDAARRNVDLWLAGSQVTTYAVLPIPPGSLAGDYRLTLVAYRGRDNSGERELARVPIPQVIQDVDVYRTLPQDGLIQPMVQVAPGLRLEGAWLAARTRSPGDEVEVRLAWRRLGSVVATDAPIVLRREGELVASWQSAYFRHRPPASWADGELVIERRFGTYPAVRGPLTMQLEGTDAVVELGDLYLDPAVTAPPDRSPRHAQRATLAGVATLLGYDLLRDHASPAAPPQVTLYWRAANPQPLSVDYSVFVHLVAPDGRLVGQKDGLAGGAQRPTSRWVEGQTIIDRFELDLAEPDYRGPVSLQIGLYDARTGERVPVVGSALSLVTLETPLRLVD